jgi:hypothetical protein
MHVARLRILEEPLNHARDPFQGVLDHLEVFHVLAQIGRVSLEPRQTTHDAVQRVVDFMGDARGEFADGG